MDCIVKAVIFDLDDTLFLTGRAWREAEVAFLRALDLPHDDATLERFAGRGAREVARSIHETFRPPLPLEYCRSFFEAILCKTILAAEVRPAPGADEVVRRLQGRCRLAVASGSPMKIIAGLLAQAGLASCFDCLVSSETVAQGKPEPDVYLAAARQLAVISASCVAIEDSLVGVQAARNAGMTCLAIPSQPGERTAIQALEVEICNDLVGAETSLERHLATSANGRRLHSSHLPRSRADT